jgi:hypothetical protein
VSIWKISVDWERNANFTGTYDNIWDDVIAVNWSLGMDKPYQHMAGEGICQITVRNVDGKYNPDNSSSPLAGYLVPFRPVKLTATVGETEITLWRGWLDDISSEWSPAASQSGNITAVLRCVGAKQLMQESELNLPLQQNKRGDEIAALVLDQVVLPPAVIGGWLLQQNGYSEIGQTTFLASADDYSELEQGVMRFRYYGDIRAIDKEDDDQPLSDRSREQDAYRVLRDVTEGERGRFFFNREGKAIWWNRDHLVDLISDRA